ncbi:hypothetical protein Gorai_013173, partial [Gossypium raimondii]|nr:hypothetical protein [Gossypium raimondii]
LNDELLFKIVECDLAVAEVGDRRISKYSIVVSPIFMDIIVYVDTLTGTAYLSYNHTLPFIPTTMTTIPPINATWMTSVSTKSLRNLNSKEYLANVPLTIDHSLFFTVGVGINPCVTCSNGSRDAAAINNGCLLEVHRTWQSKWRIGRVRTSQSNHPRVIFHSARDKTNFS